MNRRIICLAASVAGLFLTVFLPGLRAQEQGLPNVVLILIDDMGWKDLGCYGNPVIDTPHIDRLAREGVRFTDFYAAGAVCSPTRCAIQSGQNQARIGITAHIPGHWRPFDRVITPLTTMALPLDTVTIAEMLKTRGYRTGYVGKWHLGNGPQFQPDRQGYDFSAVIGGPHLPGRYRVANKDIRKPTADEYRTEYEASLSSDFIKENSDQPFFLMVSPFAVHIPLGAMSEKVRKYEERLSGRQTDLPHPVYAAMVEHCDDMVGEIVATLESEDVAERTMIIFTSDNGGLYRRYDYRPHADDNVSDLAPLRGEKGTLFEGGIRVPLIIRYPAMANAGAVCHEPTISYDFYATLQDLAKAPAPQNQTLDGQSLLPLLKEPESKLDRDALYWHYPHYHHDRPACCVRAGDWKLIEYLDDSDEILLFNLKSDLSERRNLVEERPGRVKELQTMLRRFRQDAVARMPIPNPHYNRERSSEWWSMRTGEPIDSDSRTRFPPTELD